MRWPARPLEEGGIPHSRWWWRRTGNGTSRPTARRNPAPAAMPCTDRLGDQAVHRAHGTKPGTRRYAHWDDRVADLLPPEHRPSQDDGTTLAHLASHTSGLPRLSPTFLQSIVDTCDPTRLTRDTVFAHYARQEGKSAPGGDAEYSNWGMGCWGTCWSWPRIPDTGPGAATPAATPGHALHLHRGTARGGPTGVRGGTR